MAIGPVPPSTATWAIRRAWADLYARWGSRLTSLGVSSCRRVNGRPAPAPWSEHAWSNAWDVTGPIALMPTLARFAAAQPWAGQVLWQGRDLISGAVVGGHTTYVHITGDPLRNPIHTAQPPCAFGPGGPSGPGAAALPPLPVPAATIAGESWAPVARLAARELVTAAERIGRAGVAVRTIIARGG